MFLAKLKSWARRPIGPAAFLLFAACSKGESSRTAPHAPARVAPMAATGKPAVGAPVRPRTPACQRLSPQERWGIVVKDPTKNGYRSVARTAHFDAWAAPGAKVDHRSLRIGEAHIKLMEKMLDMRFNTRISLFIYPSVAAVKKATGMNLLIRRDVRQLHIPSSRQLHEVVHLMVYHAFGHRSVSLFDEGLAEAYGNWSWRPGDPADKLAVKDWTGKHVHRMAADWLRRKITPPLNNLLADRDFRRVRLPKGVASYVIAASFVLWLRKNHGLPKLKRVLRQACNEDTAAVVRGKLRRIYNVDVVVLERNWHGFLRRWKRN